MVGSKFYYQGFRRRDTKIYLDKISVRAFTIVCESFTFKDLALMKRAHIEVKDWGFFFLKQTPFFFLPIPSVVRSKKIFPDLLT